MQHDTGDKVTTVIFFTLLIVAGSCFGALMVTGTVYAIQRLFQLC